MNEKVKQTLDTVLERFKSGDIPEVVSYAMFPLSDIPSSRWSLLNRTIMFISGTADARGYKQWLQVGRYVKKGSKSLYILVPYFKKVEDEGDKVSVMTGFGCQAVFRVEDTDGEPLEYQNLELGEIPLLERAEEWGISVKAIPGSYRYAGYYATSRKEICLATKDECVFFHEISHVAHEKVIGSLKAGQDPLQEVVAQLAAQCLCMMVGKSADKFLGTSYRYIERYAAKIKTTPHKACLKVISDTEKVLEIILWPAGEKNQVAEEKQAIAV
jgi:antirestriction protein ArdC